MSTEPAGRPLPYTNNPLREPMMVFPEMVAVAPDISNALPGSLIKQLFTFTLVTLDSEIPLI